MIKHKVFIAITILVMIIVLVVSIVFLLPNLHKVDSLEVNDIIEKSRDSIASDKEFFSFKYNYSVIDMRGRFLYNSIGIDSDNYNTTISISTTNNYVVRDLTVNSVDYKVIVDTEINSSIKSRALTVRWMVIGLIIALFVVIVGYFAYIQIKVYLPFRKLDKFAEEVARGNYDLPLTMDKANSFGNFQEAFDIMRINLKQSRQNELRIEQEKKTIIAELSHDLKLPIASIIALAECIQLKSDDNKASKIINQANQINHIITDIYNSTLNDIGELKVNATEHISLDILSTIEDTDYLHKTFVGVMPDIKVMYDELRLRQILDNIISNSYKYANTQIKIEFEQKEDFLTIKVTDYGYGVNENEVGSITDKFVRGKNVGQTSGEGLGLYVAKVLAEKQGGKIEIDQDEGFSVIIYLKTALT